MKDLFYVVFLGVSILVNACKIVNIPPPQKNIKPSTYPTTPISYVSIPLHFNLSPYLKMVDHEIPSVYEGSKEQCEGLSVSYGFNRSPLRFKAVSNGLNCSVEGGLWLKANYCPKCHDLFDKEGTCVVPRVHVSCGLKEPLRRFSLDYTSRIHLGSAYNVVSKTQVGNFSLKDPCNISFIGYDITKTVEQEVRKELIKLEEVIDENIQKISLKPYVADAWREMQKPIPLEGLGFLYLKPTNLSIHSLEFIENSIKGVTTIALMPSVRSEKIVESLQPLPPLGDFKSPENFNLEVPVTISYDTLTSLFNPFVKGLELSLKKKKIIFESVSVYGTQNEKLIIQLVFKGFRRGTIYLLGKPSIHAEKKEVRLEAVDFELKTKGVLLNMARWIFDAQITQAIQDKTHFSYDGLMQQAVKEIERGMNTSLSETITIQGKVIDASIKSLNLNDSFLTLYFALEGNLKLNIK